jgi:chromate transporter
VAPGSLAELGSAFLRLGLTAFGGPAAHVGLMRDEFVRRRAWLSDADFLDLVGASNLIPGPTSTEIALHVGHRRAGVAGFFLAGICFVGPAVAIVAALAWAYESFGARPEALAALAGVAPVVVAIIAHAAAGLGRAALRDRLTVVVGIAAALAAYVGAAEIAVLVAAGLVGLGGRRIAGAGRAVSGLVHVGPLSMTAAGAAGVGATAASVASPLTLLFAKIGAVLFGSGYLLVALLRSELVEGLGWITERQLLDAVAIGQLTPGPVTTSATFIGWLVAGPAGAAAATVGIFAPAFAAVALSIPVLPRLGRSPAARAFLDGVNSAAVALIAVVAVELGRVAIVDLPTLVLGGAALAALATGRVGSGLLIVVGGGIGVLLALARLA